MGLCDRLLVTVPEVQKISSKIGSLLSCLLCGDTTPLHILTKGFFYA